jgi:glycosyltransferase involved in cell wall biosynthesis
MPLAMAGTEVYTHTLASLQKTSGHGVAVLTPHIEYYRRGQFNEHYEYDGIDVYQFLETADPTNRDIHYGNKKPEGLCNFSAFLTQYKPDIIHFHELNRSIGFTIEHVKIARKSGAKVFLTMHLSSYSCNTNVLIYEKELCDGIIRNFRCTKCSCETIFDIPALIASPIAHLSLLATNASLVNELPQSRFRTLMSVAASIERLKQDLGELVRNVHQLVSYSQWYKKILLENGVPETKITLVPSALVRIANKEIRKSKRSAGHPIKMVFVGRIQPTKGIHLIIDAVRFFSPGQVQIDVYGKTEDTPYFKKCVEDCKEMYSVNLKDEIKREDVVDILSGYDIFCLASTFSEMSPLVIQEAFAAGIPVLASKVYGNMEHIQHGINGLLFEFNSARSLRAEIQHLVDEPALLERLKRNIIPPEEFSVVSEAYLKLYMDTQYS